MEPGSGEFYKIKNWVDTFMRIPFSEYKTLPISINDGIDTCHDFMANAQKILNEAVYGLNDAKMQIMQMLGQLITNPKAIGSAIAIHGPPGTGKTSLVKEGISKILNRPFAFIALGGATDSSFLEGHGYTYEGSTWGKIVQILIDSKCMNPVIYFDELDKNLEAELEKALVGLGQQLARAPHQCFVPALQKPGCPQRSTGQRRHLLRPGSHVARRRASAHQRHPLATLPSPLSPRRVGGAPRAGRLLPGVRHAGLGGDDLQPHHPACA